MKITLGQLRERIQCMEEFEAVEENWPDGVEVTPENLAKLSDTAFVELIDLAPEDARKEYEATYEALYRAYDESREDAVQKYSGRKFAAERNRGIDRRKQIDDAWDEMCKVTNALYTEFSRSVYIALAKALNTQEEPRD